MLDNGLAPARKRSMFEIDAELDQVAIAFDQLEEGGTDQEVTDAVFAYFGDVMSERDRKLDGYARFISDRTALAKAQKEEANRILALSKANEGSAKRLKELLYWLFKERGWSKLDTPLHKFWIQNNGGVLPLTVLETDATKLPERFQKVIVTADNDAIRAALDAGETLEFAVYAERVDSIRIK